jgi:hypothetical protein
MCFQYERVHKRCFTVMEVTRYYDVPDHRRMIHHIEHESELTETCMDQPHRACKRRTSREAAVCGSTSSSTGYCHGSELLTHDQTWSPAYPSPQP